MSEEIELPGVLARLNQEIKEVLLDEHITIAIFVGTYWHLDDIHKIS